MNAPAERRIHLGRTVHNLCAQYPELVEILRGLGFVDIVKPGMLQTAGRFMTLPNGVRMKGISRETLLERLRAEGFTVEE